ncbi:MAG: hypothetical protein E5Y10_34215 [Mesorhizobium sp.]|uniref:hypothetical protein n=1 Tax=Mesorhizobium sp. TaxID=1871066 RepID=UPI00121FCA6E|nr:hypothetical protein [Mesorhizobium sp.]TIN32414.1 MAG: hypothetical protein E5Y13_34330 [Mesorhizobium sp.]TJU83692.1 MAG: hypothetical protein E5Y10_34215 [Mesorhizobium sp.]
MKVFQIILLQAVTNSSAKQDGDEDRAGSILERGYIASDECGRPYALPDLTEDQSEPGVGTSIGPEWARMIAPVYFYS